MNTQFYSSSAKQALIISAFLLAVGISSFFLVEPQVGRGQAFATSTPFRIEQVITGEISFLVQPNTVTMSGNLNGITGGTSNGSTSVKVQTNAVNGYYMDIAFASNGSADAMRGQTTGSQSIHDYQTATSSLPDYAFSTASTSAVFAYTVGAVDPTDVHQNFLNNGSSLCGTGGTSSTTRCWMEPRTSNFTIIDRGSSATDGATSTIYFRVHVPNNPNPGLEADTYVATATLTATNQ
jgi:hypothetical protein